MEINKTEISNDIITIGVEAENFPLGVKQAYHQLETSIGGFWGREVYGLSEMVNGQLKYWACATEKHGGEGPELHLAGYTIPKVCTCIPCSRGRATSTR